MTSYTDWEANRLCQVSEGLHIAKTNIYISSLIKNLPFEKHNF